MRQRLWVVPVLPAVLPPVDTPMAVTPGCTLCETEAVTCDEPDIPKVTLLEFAKTTVPLVAVCVPAAMARLHTLIPIAFQDGVLTVALADPANLGALDDLRTALGCQVKGVAAPESQVRAAVADPDAHLPREQAGQCVRTGRPLCVRLAGGYVWWSSAIREVEHDTRGLPFEVWTLAGSLYRLEFPDRTTLSLPGLVER